MNAFSREHTSTLETMVSAGPVEWLVFGTAMGGLLLIDVAYAGRERRHSTLRSGRIFTASILTSWLFPRHPASSAST
jgi:hypothetical protein